MYDMYICIRISFLSFVEKKRFAHHLPREIRNGVLRYDKLLPLEACLHKSDKDFYRSFKVQILMNEK